MTSRLSLVLAPYLFTFIWYIWHSGITLQEYKYISLYTIYEYNLCYTMYNYAYLVKDHIKYDTGTRWFDYSEEFIYYIYHIVYYIAYYIIHNIIRKESFLTF